MTRTQPVEGSICLTLLTLYKHGLPGTLWALLPCPAETVTSSTTLGLLQHLGAAIWQHENEKESA